jgi:hypothetical protein
MEIKRGNLKNLQKLISDLKLYRGKKHFKKGRLVGFLFYFRFLKSRIFRKKL